MQIQSLVMLIVVVTAVWVYFDAKSLGARKGLVGGLGDMGPGGWFACCLLIWIVGFPLYLAYRGKIRTAAAHPSVENRVSSVPDEIQKLSDLKDRGVLTEAEFSKKKTELLARL